jgi:hypothetical protein
MTAPLVKLPPEEGGDEPRFVFLPASGNEIPDEKLIVACQHFMAGARVLMTLADTPERARAIEYLNNVLLWSGQAALRDAQASRIVTPPRRN